MGGDLLSLRGQSTSVSRLIDPAAIGQTQCLIADSIRLISTANIDEPALAPLADAEHELELLAELEGMTAAPRSSPLNLPAGVVPGELRNASHGFGWSYVNAAFCYTRAGGNRFNGPERGAWYACYGELAAATAQQEVAWHLGRELGYTGVYDNITSYCELKAGFATRFHDLFAHAEADFLLPDPALSYPAGQQLARSLLAAQSNGVLYPSSRNAGGQCLAAFRPHLMQGIHYGERWRFCWDGDPKVKIELIPMVLA